MRLSLVGMRERLEAVIKSKTVWTQMVENNKSLRLDWVWEVALELCGLPVPAMLPYLSKGCGQSCHCGLVGGLELP